jgi:hypothetical protein
VVVPSVRVIVGLLALALGSKLITLDPVPELLSAMLFVAVFPRANVADKVPAPPPPPADQTGASVPP